MNLIFEKNPFLYEEPGGMERLGRLGLSMPMEELAAASSVSSFTCLDTLYCYAVLRNADLFRICNR
jgi:hypothetical protein